LTRRLVTAVAVTAAIAAAWWLWPTDTRRIRSRLTSLASAVSVPAGEPDLQRVTRLAALARGLALDVSLHPGDGMPILADRDAVVALASRLGSIGGPTSIELSNIEIDVDADGRDAVATALVRVRTGGDAVRPLDNHVVRFELVKVDGDWLLRRAAPEQALVRP